MFCSAALGWKGQNGSGDWFRSSRPGRKRDPAVLRSLGMHRYG